MEDYLEQVKQLDVSIIKSIISQCLGYAIIVGSLALKVPQILKVLKSGSAEGLAISMFLFEVLTFSVSMIYHNRMGYPFFTYGEGVFILAQLYILVFLILHIRGQFLRPTTIGAIIAYFGIIIAGLQGIIPMEIVSFLQSISIIFTIASRVPQILQNTKNQSTGQLSGLMIFLNFGGSCARILTTLQLGDNIILLGYSTSAFLNFVILVQIYMYQEKKKAE